MLEVGNGNLTPQEEKSHFALWCMMSSPLLAGNNLTAASPELIKILTAAGPLSVNQDDRALQARPCGHGSADGGGIWQAFAKPLADGSTAALILNRNASAAVNATVAFKLCNVSVTSTAVTDLWTGELLGSFSKEWSAELDPHAHRLIKISTPTHDL